MASFLHLLHAKVTPEIPYQFLLSPHMAGLPPPGHYIWLRLNLSKSRLARRTSGPEPVACGSLDLHRFVRARNLTEEYVEGEN